MSVAAKRRALLICAAMLFVLLVFVELFSSAIFDALEYGDSLYQITSRALGGVACVLFICVLTTKKILIPRVKATHMLIFLPCMLIAINNFPFISVFSGAAYINARPIEIALYAMLCFCVGFFEEMAFRGCVFTVALQRCKKNTLGVFLAIVISSAVFAVVHLLNLIAGAGFGSVMLQVGYSFLIGAMCSVILVKTANIWYCVILHAVYNFAGGVVFECGGGTVWDTATVILTVIVSLAVAAYVIYVFIRITPREIQELLNDRSNSEQNNISNK